jgi:predicted DNA-binding transcriptional regulator YafY
MSVRELAQECDMNIRTVYRYLAALEEAHVPVLEVRRGRYRIQGGV